jgi:hypothetical protein
MSRGLAAEDASFIQLSLAGLMVQLTPLGAGFPKPALTALRLRAEDLPACRQLYSAGLRGALRQRRLGGVARRHVLA